jgi:hypothetical protein
VNYVEPAAVNYVEPAAVNYVEPTAVNYVEPSYNGTTEAAANEQQYDEYGNPIYYGGKKNSTRRRKY